MIPTDLLEQAVRHPALDDEPTHSASWRSPMHTTGSIRRSITKRDILNLLCKRKGQIIIVPLLALVLVTIGSYAMPRAYEAYATVYVKRNLPPVPGLTSTAYQMVLDRREVLNSEVELIKSRAVAEKAAEILSTREFTRSTNGDEQATISITGTMKSAIEAIRGGIRNALVGMGLLDARDEREELIEALRKKVKAKPSLNSNIVTLSFQFRDPEIAAHVVNTMLDVYLEERLSLLKRPGVYAFYTDELAQSEKRIQALQDRVQALKDKQNTVSFDEEIRLKLTQLGDLERNLRQTRADMAELGTKLLTIQRQYVNQDGVIKKQKTLGRNPRVDQLNQQLLELQIERNRALTLYSPDSREVAVVDEAIARVHEQLAIEPMTVIEQESVVNNEIRQSLEKTMYEIEADYAAKTVREKLLAEQVSQIKNELVELDRYAAEIDTLQDTMESAKQTHLRYLEQAEDARIAEATTANTTNVRVVNYATPPSAPMRSRLIVIIAGLMAGLFMGLALAFISEFFDHTVSNTDDVETHLGLPLIASLPESNRLRRGLRGR